MLFLVLSIILNALIFTFFKWFGLKKIDTFQAIVVNYFVCVITGVVFTGFDDFLNQPSDSVWIYIALGLGAVFILIFNLMAITAQKFSMAAASIASKMAFVVPVLFSIFYLKVQSNFEWYNVIGVVLAVAATYMSSANPKDESKPKKQWVLILPFLVFIGNGFIDTSINFTNLRYLNESTAAVFPIYIFLSAAVIGGIIMLFRKEPLYKSSITSGLALGIVNYFTVYFFLRALGQLNNNGAFVFPIFNTGIVILSALVGILFFKEKLTKLNKAGIITAILAITLVML
jgi:drug/metabolite transporter (DMT)-like permease